MKVNTSTIEIAIVKDVRETQKQGKNYKQLEGGNMAQLNTKEKCTLRDLIKEEIKSLDKAEDGYGQYRYDEYEYCTFLLKLGRKLKLDTQQKVKAQKLYTRIKWKETYCCHNLNLIVPQFYASVFKYKNKKGYIMFYLFAWQLLMTVMFIVVVVLIF